MLFEYYSKLFQDFEINFSRLSVFFWIFRANFQLILIHFDLIELRNPNKLFKMSQNINVNL